MGYAIYFRRKTKMSCSPVSQYLRRAFSLENKTPFCLILLEYKDDIVPPCWRWLNKYKNKTKRDKIGPNHLSGKIHSQKTKEADESISKKEIEERTKKIRTKKLKRKFFFELNSFLEEQMSTFSPLLLLLLLHNYYYHLSNHHPPTLKPISLHLK